MQYAESLRKVLIRKITKAERDLAQLKLDYCRFVFGLTHRSQVRTSEGVFLVRTVDVDSMERLENGEFSRPVIVGVPSGSRAPIADADLLSLGKDWTVLADTEEGAAR